MKITILTDNPKSWIIPYIEELKKELFQHQITHTFTPDGIVGGDIMLILGCEKILGSFELTIISKLKLFKISVISTDDSIIVCSPLYNCALNK